MLDKKSSKLKMMAPEYKDKTYATEKAIIVDEKTGDVVIAKPQSLKTAFGTTRIVTDAAPRPGTYRWGIMKAKERVEERRRRREERKKKEEEERRAKGEVEPILEKKGKKNKGKTLSLTST